MDLYEVEADEGILSFDGRVLEYFQAGDRSGAWRIHVRHVLSTELEPRKGVVLFKAYTTKRYCHNAVVPESNLPALEHLRSPVDA